MYSCNHSNLSTPRSRRLLLSLVAAGLTLPLTSEAQVRITLADLFAQTGLYYRAYANRFDPQDITGGTAYVVPSNLIGNAGPDQFWDFSQGPSDSIWRFDYLPAGELSQAEQFAGATIAEQKTDEDSGSQEWLFFTPLPGEGRKVYGFYADNAFFSPENVFVPPVVDFPDPITYGAEWSASTVFINTLGLTDPDPEEGGFFEFAQRVTITSQFKVDAYGTMVLPDEMGFFGEGLRINEEVTYDFAIDFGEGQFDHVETDYTRNYYWVMPGYGIVAQLNSTQSSSPPPENFTRATAFMRMFETNKRPSSGGGCTAPQPVTDMRIRISNGTILLTWSKADCANQYVVQYTETPSDAASWRPLGQPTPNLVWQGENTTKGPIRFYRVASMR
jgi:hypothetical protein